MGICCARNNEPHRLPAASANSDMLMLPVPALQSRSRRERFRMLRSGLTPFSYSTGTGQRSQKLSGSRRERFRMLSSGLTPFSYSTGTGQRSQKLSGACQKASEPLLGIIRGNIPWP